VSFTHKEKAMHTINRRALAAGVDIAAAIAAVPTISGATAVATRADDCAHLDAELLALGAQLEPIIREWRAQRAADAQESEEFERKAELAGLPNRPWKSLPDDEWLKYQEKRSRLMRLTKYGEHDSDEDGASISWTSIHDRMHPLCDRIASCRARTLAGFAIQARAASFVCLDVFDGDQDHDSHRAFIEAACAFTGTATVTADEAVQS
jgi:hypothetical protein